MDFFFLKEGFFKMGKHTYTYMTLLVDYWLFSSVFYLQILEISF